MSYTEHRACRVCGGDLLSVLNLGNQPLANALLTEEQLEWQEPDYPLHLVRCAHCGLCQLSIVVDPEVLYRNYAYQSGHADGWHQHCESLAQEIVARKPGAYVLDIACNDGTLLRHCRDLGCCVKGVDPAGNVDTGDVPVVRAFWPTWVQGKWDVITAQNVLGHVDDPRRFLQGIARTLATDGVAIIECPWAVDLLHYRRWDTIYHEHVSYWLLKPMCLLAESVGLEVASSKHFPDLHGGTLRYYIRHKGAGREPHVASYLGSWIQEEDCQRFRDSVRCEIQWWESWFQENGQKVLAGYGASAKSSTFLNAMSFRPPLVGIFDDNPNKWNLYTPGCHFPILKPTKVLAEVDELICFAPNWKDECERKAKALGFTGEVKTLWRA